jgi:hypothetical protein
MRDRFLVIIVGSLLFACSGPPGGSVSTAEAFLFRTEPFVLRGGEERFLCYAHTLGEELVVDRIDFGSNRLVHHLLLIQTTVAEPEGFSECAVLFRPGWLPMFGAATAATRLQMPEGVGMVLPRGTQILLQLHLLNPAPTEARGVVEVALHKSARRDVESVGLVAFGRPELMLPPRQASQSVHTCSVPEALEIFAVLPHMHYLGKSLVFEIGSSDSELREVYRRQPWSFDDQYLDPITLSLPRGTRARVTCTFENTTDRTVTFGESSNDEMCFLVTFARGRRGLEGCEPGSAPLFPPDPRAGTCGEQAPNARGIGASCSAGGGQCGSDLACSLDQPQAPPDSPGFCLQIGGCQTTADCGGGGATCCAPAQAGGLINICIPEACRPADCLPK